MKNGKRPKLPRSLRWKSDSLFIWFSWRDARGKQHQKNTETTDPAKALGIKLEFLASEQQEIEQIKTQSEDMGKLPLSRVADLYFEWKAASSAAATIERERRIFNSVRKFFGSQLPVKAIKLPMIWQYQQHRRQHVSKTMKQHVTARSVNYEMHLLRNMLKFAHSWTGDLAAGYKPLRQVKSRVGKCAAKEEVMKIIETAKGNDYWLLAMWCAAVAIGTGCRGGEIRRRQLGDIDLENGKLVIRREIAKNRKRREPRLMALAEWGLRHLLERAHALGATEPQHYLLPLQRMQSSYYHKGQDAKWDVNRPMFSWTRSWRKLVAGCGMPGFRFQDLRHTFRTWGAEAGVPLEVMMAQLGHMDRETSLEYVHIQQRALERAQQLIESEQKEILATAEGRKRKGKTSSHAATKAIQAQRTASRSRPRRRICVISARPMSGQNAPARPQLAAGSGQ
jgi:integrase